MLPLVVAASGVSASRSEASSNSTEKEYGTQACFGSQDNLVWSMAHLGAKTPTGATEGPSFLNYEHVEGVFLRS